MQTRKLYDEYMITSMVPGFDPVEVESAQGTRIRSADGVEYLDCFSGISVCNAGHGHPKVVAAAKAQMDQLIHCCTYIYYNPMAGRVAEALAQITPGRLRKSFFGNSGAEAIEGAMRLARHFTGRDEFVSLTHSFHERTYASLSLTGNSSRKQSGGPFMPGVTFAPAPYFYRCPFGSQTEAECAERSAEDLRSPKGFSHRESKETTRPTFRWFGIQATRTRIPLRAWSSFRTSTRCSRCLTSSLLFERTRRTSRRRKTSYGWRPATLRVKSIYRQAYL